MDFAIQVEDLTKVYRENSTEVVAVNGVDFSIQRGEVVGIMGPSGSGKTTLLSMLGCILKPTAGSIKIYGKEVTNLSDKELPFVRRKYFGFIFQGFNLFQPLSAFENVRLPLEIKGMSKREAGALSINLLEKVNLKERAYFLPRNLSGGEKQRVAIARALAGNPLIILADEPTGNLDPDTAQIIIKLFKEINARGTTVVIATHHSDLFNNTGRRVIHLKGGELIKESIG